MMLGHGKKNLLSMILMIITGYAYENTGAHLKQHWSHFQFYSEFALKFFPFFLLAVSPQPSSKIHILDGFVWDSYLSLSRTH